MASGPHYDKYDPISGGHRAPLAAAIASANANTIYGVGLDANGRVVRGGGGNTGFVGIMIAHAAKQVGEIVDIMQNGEIVDVVGLTAGTTYYLDATGVLSTVAPAAGVNGFRVGHTVEATRLVVRFERVQG